MNPKDLDILFLTKEIPDYLHDMMFYGLNNIGCNVVDFPVKPSLHGVPHPSEFHSEQLLFNFKHNILRKNPDIMVVTALSHDFNPLGLNGWNEFVVNCERTYNPTKIVVLDGMDKQLYIYPAIRGSYQTIFKRELVEPYPGKDWFPINFAVLPEKFTYIPFSQREYDLCFIATISCRERVWVYDYLKSKADSLGLKIYIHLDKSRIPREQYLDILSRSRCALSVRGMGFDCYRYWEIPDRGTVLVADELPITIANDYMEEEHCFRYTLDESMENLGRVLGKIKGTTFECLERMALQSLVHTATFHTPEKRAAYFLSTIYR